MKKIKEIWDKLNNDWRNAIIAIFIIIMSSLFCRIALRPFLENSIYYDWLDIINIAAIIILYPSLSSIFNKKDK